MNTASNGSRRFPALAWALAAATLLVAALLVWQCADLYFTGVSAANRAETGVLLSDVYSREIVAERFGRIAWAVWLWLALLAAALVCRAGVRTPALRAPEETLLEALLCRVEKTDAIRKAEKKRRTARIVCAGICAVCAAFIAAYFIAPGSFVSRDLEPVMAQMLRHVAPWACAALAAILCYERIDAKIALREIEPARLAPRRQAEPPARRMLPVGIIRGALFAAAAALIALGILNGGMRDTLVKAINICTECIGLG